MSDGPERIGPYCILSCIGRGGMGVVYQARHRDRGTIVALKSVRIPDVGMLQCIRREIRALANIRHPGIVSIIDEGVEHGLPWYAMELVEGTPLSRYIRPPSHTGEMSCLSDENETRSGEIDSSADQRDRKTPSRWWTMPGVPGETVSRSGGDMTATSLDMPDSETGIGTAGRPRRPSSFVRAGIEPVSYRHIISLIYRLCCSLAYMHGEGIIHRDLKPDNILVKKDEWPVIVDFGLLTRYGGDDSREILHIEARTAGSVRYMSPEQIRGALVDARSDLYSLGCILYELLSGQPPFTGVNAADILRAHLTREPVPLSTYVTGIPTAIDDLVRGLLQKRPEHRIGYAADVAGILRDCGAEDGQEARYPTPKPYLYRPRFVGREAPFEQLMLALDALSRGKGGMVLIGGESGIGKTRLVLEAGREAARRNVDVFVSESSSPSHTPLESMKATLRELGDRCRVKGREETDAIFGPRGKILGLYYPALKELPGQEQYADPPELPALESRLRLFDALTETFTRLAGRCPVLLIIDDLQWIDELTRSFLEYLLAGNIVRGIPLLIFGTYRSEELSEDARRLLENPHVMTLSLNRLDRDAVADMVHHMLAMTAAPPAFCDYLTHHSEGNPFFVAEYLRAAIHEHMLSRDHAGRWCVLNVGTDVKGTQDYSSIPLPTSLRALVDRRLQDLSTDAKDLVRISAVIGRNFHETLLDLVSVYEKSRFLDTVKELLRRQIIEEVSSSTLRFVHDKIREVAYEGIEPDNYAGFHRRVAEGISGLDPEIRHQYETSLGNHWEKAGVPDKALKAYLHNATQAREQFSLQDAEEYYRHYFRLLPGPTIESIAVRRTFAVDVLWKRGLREQTRAELELSLREVKGSPDPELELDILNSLAGLCYEMAEEELCIRYSEKALAKARAGHMPSRQAGALLNLSMVYSTHGHSKEAIAVCDEALELATMTDDIQLQIQILSYKVMYLTESGDYKQAESRAMLALTLNRNLNNSRNEAYILGHLAYLYQMTGEFEKAETTFRQAVALARKLGEIKLENRIAGNLGLMLADRSRYDEALSLTERALDLARKSGDIMFEQKWLSNIGMISHYRGQTDDAIDYFKQTLLLTEKTGDDRLKRDTLGNLGMMYKQRRQWETALDFTDQALALAKLHDDEPGQSYWYGNRAEIYQNLGLIEEATRGFRTSITLLEKYGFTDLAIWSCCTLAIHILLVSGDSDEAERLCNRAEQHAQKTTEGTHHPMILHCRACVALARGHDAVHFVRELERIEKEGKIDVESGPAGNLATLKEAIHAAESGRQDLLFRGFLITAIPPKLAAALGIESQFPA